MNPKEQLLEFKSRIDADLAKYFALKDKETSEITPYINQFLNYLKDYTLQGGKRLRPALLYHTYKAFGGKLDSAIVWLSMYLELLQSYLLIHDDWIDHSDKRRGHPTLHKIYEQQAKDSQYKEDEHYGASLAVMLGDYASQLVFEIIASADLDKAKLLELSGHTAREVSDVIFGQCHDILLSFEKDYSFDDIVFVQYYKTAKYTYELPVIAGANLVGITEDQNESLMTYSTNAGVAFQMYDDILGLFGNDKTTGKSTLDDLREGKKTLLILKAYEKANSSQKKIFDQYLGNQKITDEQGDKIRQIVEETGSLEFSKSKCAELLDASHKALHTLKLPKTDSRDFLYNIVEYTVTRDV